MGVEITAMQLIWFLVAGVVLLGYALLGGYDMGVGSLYLFTRSKAHRQNMLESIGPYWDANQVWLITFGGGLFAAFPFVFATVWSGFYFALMLLLVALILRTIAIEFRYQLDTPGWSKAFDLCFGVGSILAPILFGAAMGNILKGISLEAHGDTFSYNGGFFDLLLDGYGYTVLMGVFALVLFAFHGANFINATGEEDLRALNRKRAGTLWFAVCAVFLLLTLWTFFAYPHLLQNYLNFPLFFVFPLITVLGLAYHPLAIKQKKAKLKPLFASIAVILGIVGTVAASLFPRLVPDSNTVEAYKPSSLTDFSSAHLDSSMTIYNSASFDTTLTIMLIIAGVGVPVMLIYTIFVYRKLFKKAPGETASSGGEQSGSSPDA